MEGQAAEIRELLMLCKSSREQGLISAATKDFLKELVVHENAKVLAISAGLLSGRHTAVTALKALRPLVARRAAKTFEELYDDCPLEHAHMLAAADVEEMEQGTDTHSLVYGEVEFDAFYDVLQLAAADLTSSGGRGLTLYDLGGGTGRAIFVAALAIDLQYAIGIELLSRLHDASLRILRRYRRLVRPSLSHPPLVKFYCGSFLSPEFDWSDGDLVFANSTCFEPELMRGVTERAERMRTGARVITFTTALSTPWFRIVHKRKFAMTWGVVTVFIHEKMSLEEYAARTSGLPVNRSIAAAPGAGALDALSLCPVPEEKVRAADAADPGAVATTASHRVAAALGTKMGHDGVAEPRAAIEPWNLVE
ncbi:unnamed protein product [Phaeothamnion confervicola]